MTSNPNTPMLFRMDGSPVIKDSTLKEDGCTFGEEKSNKHLVVIHEMGKMGWFSTSMGSIFGAINRKDFDFSMCYIAKFPFARSGMGELIICFAVGARWTLLPVATGL